MEKPWERKKSNSVVDAAVADQTHRPWEPKPVPVEGRIVQQAKTKAERNQRRNLPPESIFKRQEFAKNYLIDCCHMTAAIRMGADPEDAGRIGRELLNDPITLAAIQAYSSRIEKDKIVTRERIMMGLFEEANNRGFGSSASARVAAWARLAAMIGAEKPAGEDKGKEARGGVMLVPYAGGIDAWEAAAKGQQTLLKASVRE